MPLSPLCPLPPTPYPPHPLMNVPKRKVSVSLSVYHVSKYFEKFFVAFFEFIDLGKPIALMTKGYIYKRTEMRESKKIKKVLVWSGLWRF